MPEASAPPIAADPVPLKRTPLFAAHKALSARMSPFGGWELPLYYSSILKEHEAVRTRVGLFDVSHLGHLEVQGSGALSQLQPLVTQDLNLLSAGRACYSPMLTPGGHILDEMILYRLAVDRIRLVVNAANGDKVLEWLTAHLKRPVQVSDLRQSVGTLALQGPKAMETARRVSPDPLAAIPRYSVRQADVAGRPTWVARTGYTGEDGLEFFVEAPRLEAVWKTLLAQGADFGIQPIGLGARDTLRLEAGLPLGGSDLDPETTPLEAGLEWTVAWEKGPFTGREALEKQRNEGVRRRLTGFELSGRGIPRHGCPIFCGGNKTGEVTSGTLLGERAIGLGFVEPSAASPGTALEVEIHGRRVPAKVVRLPFYRRKK
ncbi:MAG: glycine cleavage system aminomethyltransferase GcvT [Candidatus Omnitrophica bacterium]|nr:glycine cleavage system aminomethyltransferase GcvT [Candidatus Omnitrophota bacterium]